MVDPALGVAEAAEGESLLQASAPTVASAAPATLTEASHDPELDMLNSLSGVKLALEIGAQNQAAAQQQLSPGAVAAERPTTRARASPTPSRPSLAMPCPSEEAPSEGLEGEVARRGSGYLGAESSRGPERCACRSLCSKLSALSRAISQQTDAAQRLPVGAWGSRCRWAIPG